MDRRRALRAGVIGLLLSQVLVTGCNLAPLTVVIPDFRSHQVEGLWVWRRTAADGPFERVGQIVFTARGDDPTAGPLVTYELIASGVGTIANLQAQLRSVSGNPDGALLTVLFDAAGRHGEFRVSSYNAAGESPLSAAHTTL